MIIQAWMVFAEWAQYVCLISYVFSDEMKPYLDLITDNTIAVFHKM